MAIDGITIKAIVEEIKEKLLGGHIQKVYQINNHLIILNVYNNRNNYRLLVSSNPQNARIHLTSGKFDNPTKPPQFAMILRKHIQNSTINRIRQVGLDRTIEITISGKDDLGLYQDKKIIVDIMGKHSNIILTDNDYKVIEAIKRISHEMSTVRAIYPGTRFSFLESDKYDMNKGFKPIDNFDLSGGQSFRKFIYTSYTGLGPQFADELAYRSGIDSKRPLNSISEDEISTINSEFEKLYKLISNNEFSPTLYKNKEKIVEFYPLELSMLGPERIELESISEALDTYYLENVNDNSLNQAKTALIKTIEHKLDKSLVKLDNLNKDLLIAKDYDKYRIEGDLLSPNAHIIKKGQDKIEVTNFYNGKQTIITLEPRKSPWDNIELKYKKNKKLHKAYDMLTKAIPKLEDDISYLKLILNQIENIETHDELEEIKDELRSQGLLKKQTRRKKKQKSSEGSNYRKYQTDNGNFIYVGKNNKQNEEITLRLANSEDLFFHIKDLPGSHVILQRAKEVKDYEIEIAAYLAAKFSKNSNDKYIDVDYTEKKNVNKAKGSKPGMVYYTDYTTYRVDLDDEPGNYKEIE